MKKWIQLGPVYVNLSQAVAIIASPTGPKILMSTGKEYGIPKAQVEQLLMAIEHGPPAEGPLFVT